MQNKGIVTLSSNVCIGGRVACGSGPFALAAIFNISCGFSYKLSSYSPLRTEFPHLEWQSRALSLAEGSLHSTVLVAEPHLAV